MAQGWAHRAGKKSLQLRWEYGFEWQILFNRILLWTERRKRNKPQTQFDRTLLGGGKKWPESSKDLMEAPWEERGGGEQQEEDYVPGEGLGVAGRQEH